MLNSVANWTTGGSLQTEQLLILHGIQLRAFEFIASPRGPI